MKINQFSRLFLLAWVAVFLLTLTAMTSVNVIRSPMQPAYSQATHCGEGIVGGEGETTFETCTTPGKDPSGSLEVCDGEDCTEDEFEIPHREFPTGRIIGDLHHSCSQDPNYEPQGKIDSEECRVEPPDNDDD